MRGISLYFRIFSGFLDFPGIFRFSPVFPDFGFSGSCFRFCFRFLESGRNVGWPGMTPFPSTCCGSRSSYREPHSIITTKFRKVASRLLYFLSATCSNTDSNSQISGFPDYDTSARYTKFSIQLRGELELAHVRLWHVRPRPTSMSMRS